MTNFAALSLIFLAGAGCGAVIGCIAFYRVIMFTRRMHQTAAVTPINTQRDWQPRPQNQQNNNQPNRQDTKQAA